MNFRKLADNMSFVMATVASLIMLGALAFQYVWRYAPCHICHWQRWPLIGAIIVGFVGGYVARGQSTGFRKAVTSVTILLVAISGAIGIYHAGIEWGFWPGPAYCTATLYIPGADPNPFTIVPCDQAAWRDPILGLSLAGYNALISLGTAIVAATIVRKAK